MGWVHASGKNFSQTATKDGVAGGAYVAARVESRGRRWGVFGLACAQVYPLDAAVSVGGLADVWPIPRVSLVLDITLTKGVGVTGYRAIPVTQDEDQDRPRPATPDEAAILRELIGPGGDSNGP